MNRNSHKTIAGYPRRAAAWLTGYEGIPYLARSTFRYEFLAIFTFAFAAAAMDGGFARYFVEKTLHGPGWILAAIVSAGAVGNFTAALVVPIIRRRRQMPVLVARMVLCGVLLTSAALLSPGRYSSYIFAIIMLLIAALNATWVNARTTLWQCNYPNHLRGQIISRFTIAQMAVLIVVVKVQSRLMDAYPGFYRVLFVLGGISAIVTAAFYMRVRLRGEKARLRQASVQSLSLNPMGLLDVLRKDRLFARYMMWQMLLGSATLAGEPVVAKMLATRFQVGYATAITVMTIAPMLVQLVSTPILGRLYDTMNIFVFRGSGAAFWAAGRFIMFWAASTTMMPLMILGGATCGIAGSFGGLAWSLGHMNFTKPDRAPLYMGVHMLLTGIRGATMPFLGMWLYESTPVGIHILWITGAMHVAAAIGTFSMRNAVLPDTRPTAAVKNPD